VKASPGAALISADDSFAALMAGLCAGEPDAATAVFQRFTGRLIGLSRRRIDSRLRAKADSEDVVQSVYKSFFRRSSAGDFTFSWDDPPRVKHSSNSAGRASARENARLFPETPSAIALLT
jgi:hypothetical protein